MEPKQHQQRCAQEGRRCLQLGSVGMHFLEAGGMNTRGMMGRCCQVSTLVLSWSLWQTRSLFPVLAGVSRAFQEAKPWFSQQQELRSFRFPQAASGTAQDIYPLQGFTQGGQHLEGSRVESQLAKQTWIQRPGHLRFLRR